MARRLTRVSAGRIVFACTVLFVTYFLAMFALNIVRSQQLGDQESRLQADIDELQSRYERLQALEQYLSSDEYVESVAREQLGLVKEGETAFIALSTQATPSPEEEPGLWWEKLVR